MTRNVLIGSVALCLLSLSLSQIPDPALFGIASEPGRILFYGGFGLLAWISALMALGSGLYLYTRDLGGGSKRRYRFIVALMFIAIFAVLAAVVARFWI